jgi:hypothetical protein
MALQGKLKGFGIADILQLIGQQQKTGVLVLKNRQHEVRVYFRDGNIVRTESLTRKKKDLIGSMLVRADLITEQQLEEALETQKRTLKRLGDVLVSSGALTAERFKLMVQLQATETLYGLFSWNSGTYDFKLENVEADADEAITPLRAESVLMEGFRMVDEWPLIRKTIPHDALTFEKLKPLPAQAAEEEDVDAAFDDAFSESGGAEDKSEFKSVGKSERRVYELIAPGRDVRKLIDLSCLGEFETIKALCNLATLEYLRILTAEGKAPVPKGEGVLSKVGALAARVLATAAVLAVLGLVVSRLPVGLTDLGGASATTFADPAAQRFIAQAQQARIAAALEVFRLEKGELPEGLQGLVEAGLLQPEDLRYPWREEYYYRRIDPQQFILLPPLR